MAVDKIDMTQSPLDQPSTSPQINGSLTDDEIDLQRYLEILLRWWREISTVITVFVILAVFAIFTMRLLLPPIYEASADVAIVRTVNDINFDERFVTIAEDVGSNATSLGARRSALVGLVTTGAIAQEVIDRVGDQLSPEWNQPATLLDQVNASTASAEAGSADSDLIRITVQAADPDLAATIATTWAQVYVRHVNTIYGQVPDEVLISIQNELKITQQRYLDNQQKLEAFIAESRIDSLNNLVTVFQQRLAQEVSLQQAFLRQWQATQEQLATAQALYTQVAQGGEGAARSNMAAVQILKVSVYGMPPQDLQLQMSELPEINAADLLLDLEGLINSLQQRQQDLDERINNRSQELGLVDAATVQTSVAVTTTLPISTAYQQLRTVKAQLETENARQQQLIQQRDLSWETFKSLSTKVAELNLTRAAASSEVRLGAVAVAPTDSIPRISLLTAVILAAIMGFGVGVVAIFIAEYQGKKPAWGHAQRSTSA